MKRRSNLALSGLVLAGLGYLAGILTAPKSGKETRKDIQRAAIRTKRDVEKKLKVVHAELGELLERGQATLQKLSAKAGGELKRAIKTGQQAKDNVRDVLSAVHEGESDDHELQKALDDAIQAADNLKKYVKKHGAKKKK